MSKKLRDVRKRSEITENVEQSQSEMQEKEAELERETQDLEVTRETLDALEGGTEEGANDVSEAIERAEDVTEKKFEDDGEELTGLHTEGEDAEREFQEGADATGRDAERIVEASGAIETQENLQELEAAREHALRDREFLDERIADLDESIRRSQEDYEGLRSRVQAKGGG